MHTQIKKASLFVTVAGLLVIISFLTMTTQTGGARKPAVHPNVRGFNSAIIWFELLESPDELFLALGDPGTEQGRALRLTMDTLNHYDFFFLACYSVFYASLSLFLYTLLSERRGRLDRPLLYAGIALAVLMLIGDCCENLRLLELSAYTNSGEVSEGSIGMLMLWTRIKWFSIFIASLLLATQYTRYFTVRIAGVLFAILFIVPSISGFAAFFIPGKGFLLETASSLLGVAWASALVHGIVVLKRNW
ncbi:MAG: hypothetical protein JXA20_01660 [Spirochaetes bacterium]|nr:hypothetical protein [Spirochaetota bacterium]